MKKCNYDFVTIEEINHTLTATVAIQLQNYVQRSLRGEYGANYIVCEFFPKTAEEIQLLFALDDALKAANYVSAIFGMAVKDAEETPYYLKIQWPVVQQ